METYLARDGVQTGPFSDAQLQEMLRDGTAGLQDLAWREGAPDWQPLQTLIAVPQPPPLPAVLPHAPLDGPTGVGGWLLFFCIGLTILSPLLSGVQILTNWKKAHPAFATYPSIGQAVTVETAGSTALLVYGFIVGCMIWAGHRRGREIARTFLLLRVLLFLLMEGIAIFLVRQLPDRMVQAGIGAALASFWPVLAHAVIWWAYFKKSKRVLNTYGPAEA